MFSVILQGAWLYSASLVGIALSYLWFWPIRALSLATLRERIAEELA